jgi:L-fuculose-phosphate aldolase
LSDKLLNRRSRQHHKSSSPPTNGKEALMDPDQPTRAEAAELIRVGRVMYDRGLTAGNDGNISVRLDYDSILITATGVCKGRLTPGCLLVVSVSSGQVIGGSMSPSSETNIHLATYRSRPDVSAVIHAHSPFATALAITGTPFPADLLPEVVFTLGQVPTTRPAVQRTQDYLDSVVSGLGSGQAVILDHHGAMTVGVTLEDALLALERIEHVAHVYWIARSLGPVQHLSAQVVEQLAQRRNEQAPA